MKTEGNTILITGGATGIGLALAQSLVKSGNEVIICGRREDKLKEAKGKLPQIHTRASDLSKDSERKSLHDWIVNDFPDINILVNNAGMQRVIDFTKGTEQLLAGDDEIDINFKAYVHLSAHFIPEFQKQKEAAIINISSGLGLVPMAIMPIYCATKAAIHSFSMSLRHQLRNTSVKVFEIIPPTVDTELDRGARSQRGQQDRGIKPEEVAEATMQALEKDQYEIGMGRSENLRNASRDEMEKIFQNMNRW